MTAEAEKKAATLRTRQATLEALDLPTEAQGVDGVSRTKREIEEWLRPDGIEAE